MKVTYDSKLCAHAGNCVKGLPEVFKVVDGKLTVDEKAASDDDIRRTVATCPSGALQVVDEAR